MKCRKPLIVAQSKSLNEITGCHELIIWKLKQDYRFPISRVFHQAVKVEITGFLKHFNGV